MHPSYRRDIDGLRALAVLAVVLFHAHAPWLPGGFIGVDIFFVISGYLITSILLRDLAAGKFSIATFYARRVRRIFPALLAVLAACFAVGWVALLPEEFAALGKHMLAAGGFFSDIALWKESGYFDEATALKPLMHLWSLGVEEQFYLLWPLLLAAAWRWHRHVGIVLGALLLLSLAASVALTPRWPEASFYLPHTRFWELMAGGLLARAEWRGWQLRAGVAPAFSLMGVAALFVGFCLIEQTQAYPGWRGLLPVLGSVALIAAGPSPWPNRLLATRLLVAIGLISYPLYLWHWPLLSFAHIVESGHPACTVIASAVALAFALATATYYGIERPVRFGRWRHARGAIAALLVLMLALAATGSIAWQRGGLQHTRGLDSPMFADLQRLDDFRRTLSPCAGGNPAQLSWCYQNREGAPTYALFGDSHADHLFPGIAATSPATWLLVGHSSCPPLLGVKLLTAARPDECEAKNQQAMDTILAAPSIHTVVLANVGSFYLGHSLSPQHRGAHAPSRYRLDDGSGEANARVYARGLRRTVEALRAAGKQVVLVMDMPQFSFFPVRCIDRPITFEAPRAPTPCAAPKQPMLDAQADYRALLTQLATDDPGILLYDPYPAFCDAAQCFMAEPGMLYYRDSHHLSMRGATKFARAFTAWLEAPAPAR